MQAAHRRALQRTGELVTVRRVSGTAPRTVSFSVEVYANVQSYAPDTVEPSQTGYSASQLGGITQNDRKVIIVAQDLSDARFPLPVLKNDKIVLANGEVLNVTGVDEHKRSLAGAIELTAAGIA